MSLESMAYLLEVYWPFVAAAVLIGMGTGWFSVRPKG